MAAKERQSDPPLRSRLFNEFFRFSFYKAVTLLERLSPAKKRLGETLDPGEEAVRFSVKPGLSFPPSDISNLHQDRSRVTGTNGCAVFGSHRPFRGAPPLVQ